MQKLTMKGLSDKDIIKTLKKKGYSYDQIEKAMLQAVKGGIEETQAPPMPQAQPSQNFDDFYTQTPQQPVYQEQQQPEMTEFSAVDEYSDHDVDPEAMIEELIEGVVEDKWKRFDDQMRKFEDDLAKMRADLRNAVSRIESAAPKDTSKESDIRFQEFSEQMDDLDARVGGLEKAFKQFLPSLTRNIESLSTVIHEIKERHSTEPGQN